MSLIKKVMVTDRVSEVEYPGIDGFVIKLNYITRDELTNLRQKCLVSKFNKISHQREETVDNDKFLKLYTKKVLAGWRGLVARDLAELIPVDLSTIDETTEVPYNEEDALVLIQNSTIFDQFITDAMGDISTFEANVEATEEKN